VYHWIDFQTPNHIRVLSMAIRNLINVSWNLTRFYNNFDYIYCRI
jgi:hypothetical protein